MADRRVVEVVVYEKKDKRTRVVGRVLVDKANNPLELLIDDPELVHILVGTIKAGQFHISKE